MDIYSWLVERGQLGTAAALARVTSAISADYAAVERELRLYMILEVLVANEGNHAAAAKDLGVHRHTIQRALRDLNLTSGQVREIAKQIKGAENHASN